MSREDFVLVLSIAGMCYVVIQCAILCLHCWLFIKQSEAIEDATDRALCDAKAGSGNFIPIEELERRLNLKGKK